MNQLCYGCLCRLEPGELPLCGTCYDELLALPTPERLERIAEIVRTLESAKIAESLVGQLTDLIEQSKRYSPFRLN